jgi:hypothetical protein
VKLQLLSILLGLTIISISAPAAFADTVSFPETICQEGEPPAPGVQCDEGADLQSTLVNDLLDALGIPRPGSENLGENFGTPALPITNPPTVQEDITITFEEDSGLFEFSFGFCPATATAAIDAVTQKQAWATACLAAATEVFDDTGASPGDTFTFSSCAAGCDTAPGDVLFWYLLPNNNLATFNADPSQFYPSSIAFNPLRAPLFSVEDANPGELDQMLAFLGGGVTLFTFEDLTRTVLLPTPGGSDSEFTDLAFSIDIELINQCEELGLTDMECTCQIVNPTDPICDPPLGGEFLTIDSSALVLAGLQTSLVWMLPIAIAGTAAGITAFQLRRK